MPALVLRNLHRQRRHRGTDRVRFSAHYHYDGRKPRVHRLLHGMRNESTAGIGKQLLQPAHAAGGSRSEHNGRYVKAS